MSRVRFDLPPKFHFSTELPLRIGDINYGGHLGNDAVLALAHEARVRMFRSFGWTEHDVEGKSIIMSDAMIMFKAEAFYGDIALIDVAAADLATHGCDLYYRFVNKVSGKELARVKTGIVFFDYQTRSVVPMPEGFRSRFTL